MASLSIPHHRSGGSASKNSDRPSKERDAEAALVAADRLFHTVSIAATSMRDVAASAGIPLRRLTRVYPTKQDLVVAHLQRRHDNDVRLLDDLRTGEKSPTQILEAALGGIVADLLSPDFRGCPFLNAAAETGYEYLEVARIVREHRDWYNTETTNLMRAAGHPRPADAADDLILARDGGMASIHGGNLVAAVSAMRRAIQRSFAEIDQP